MLNLKSDKTVSLLLPTGDNSGHSLQMDPDSRTIHHTIEMTMEQSDGDAAEINDICKIIVADKPTLVGNLATIDALRGNAGAATQADFNQDFQRLLTRVGDGSREGRAIDPEDVTKWQTTQIAVKVVR